MEKLYIFYELDVFILDLSMEEAFLHLNKKKISSNETIYLILLDILFLV